MLVKTVQLTLFQLRIIFAAPNFLCRFVRIEILRSALDHTGLVKFFLSGSIYISYVVYNSPFFSTGDYFWCTCLRVVNF